MKIVHVIGSMGIGGAERLLADMLPLQAQSNDVKLVVLKEEKSHFHHIVANAGIEIHNLACKSYYNPLNVCALIKYIKNADIVHAHLFPTVYWVAFASLFCRKPKLVYTEHSTHNKRRDKKYLRPIEHFVYSKYRRIIGISQQTQETLMQWLKAKPFDPRFVVINNGVALDKFTNTQQKVDTNCLIMISRFAKMKDQETVIRAMTYVENCAQLFLVGDGPNKQHCEDIARNIGVEERVHFLGARYDIPELVSQSYIGIQSSIWEGFGLTAVELMAAGKPVLATNVNGLKQVVEGAGKLFEVGDYRTLAILINDLLKNKELYNTTAAKCRKRAQLYDIKTTVEKYQAVYDTL